MTDEEDVLFLSNEPLPLTATSVKLALRSSDGTRGKDDGDEEDEDIEERLLEGYITLDPVSIQTFLIAGTPPRSSLAPDPRYWDLYLVIIPFTLQRLPGNKYYKWVEFRIDLANQEVSAFDLFPRNILTPAEGKKGYTISIHGRFQEIDDDRLDIGKQLRFAPLQPKIKAFGDGQRTFSWIFEGVGEKGEVEPETKHALAVLRVPRSTSKVEGNIRCRAELQKNIFGSGVPVESKIKKYPFHLDLQDVPIFRPTRRTPRTKSASHTEPSFDVCLVCALPKEANALKEVLERQYRVEVQLSTSSPPRREYYHTHIYNERGKALRVQVSWLPDYGPEETSLHVKDILMKFHPRFVGMTGICAGDKRRVALGDLVLAKQAFTYEAGKIKRNSQDQEVIDPETQPRGPSRQVIHAAINFDGWESMAREIKRPISKRQQRDWLLNTLYTRNCLPKDIALDELEQHAPLWKELFNELRTGPYLEPDGTLRNGEELFSLHVPYADPPYSSIHLGSVASGYKVRADNPFDDIQRHVRSTIAIDMEGSAFYSAMKDENIPFLFVKGVSDYADAEKDDSFHEYAATISSVYMLSFIRYFVTSQHVPERKKQE